MTEPRNSRKSSKYSGSSEERASENFDSSGFQRSLDDLDQQRPQSTQHQSRKTRMRNTHSQSPDTIHQPSSPGKQDDQSGQDRREKDDRPAHKSYWLLPKLKLRSLLIASVPALIMSSLAWGFLQNQKTDLKTESQQVESSESDASQKLPPPQNNLNLPVPDLFSIPSADRWPNSGLPSPSNPDTATYQGQDLFYIHRQHDIGLQGVVDSIVNIAARDGLPIHVLSITLIDLDSNRYAQYQGKFHRYPASVVKMFWMAILFEAIEREGVTAISQAYSTRMGFGLTADLDKLIKESDNEAGSRIVDFLTGTESGPELEKSSLGSWIEQRYSLNTFFRQKGYEDLNISQKTFPIPFLNYDGPEGRDAQMRGNPGNPTRNQITTNQAAQLMHEIMQGSLGGQYNQRMQKRLRRDLTTDWRSIDPNLGHFNPVKAFLGEGLAEVDPAIQLYSKAGWTSQTRQEVAYIEDGSKRYVLAIFAEDKSYAQNEQIFPKIAKYVRQTMQ